MQINPEQQRQAGSLSLGETVTITYFTKYYSAVYVTNTRNDHNDGIIEFHDGRHFRFNLI